MCEEDWEDKTRDNSDKKTKTRVSGGKYHRKMRKYQD